MSHFGWVWSDHGAFYGVTSGWFADLVYLSAIGALYKKINCGVTGCWRPGFHKVDGSVHQTCKKHHPNGGVTAEEIKERHHHFITKLKEKI